VPGLKVEAVCLSPPPNHYVVDPARKTCTNCFICKRLAQEHQPVRCTQSLWRFQSLCGMVTSSVCCTRGRRSTLFQSHYTYRQCISFRCAITDCCWVCPMTVSKLTYACCQMTQRDGDGPEADAIALCTSTLQLYVRRQVGRRELRRYLCICVKEFNME